MNDFTFYAGIANLIAAGIWMTIAMFREKEMSNSEVFMGLCNLIIGFNCVQA